MRLIAFIDYDNLGENQKLAGLLAIATRIIMQIPQSISIKRGTCDLRVYGGWYEGSELTPRAEKIVAELHKDFPTVIRAQRNGTPAIQIIGELACALLEDPTFHLVDTYRRKGKPSNLRVQQPSSIGCLDHHCPLPLARKLLRTGNCPITTCAIDADNLVYRHEQKIVDTMLACDLVYACHRKYDHILLVSGDDDFLPALRTAILRGSSVLRYHPKQNGTRQTIKIGQTSLMEINL